MNYFVLYLENVFTMIMIGSYISVVYEGTYTKVKKNACVI